VERQIIKMADRLPVMKTCISPVDQFYSQPDSRDSSTLRCYATSNCKQFPTFWRTVVPLPSRSSSQEKVAKLLELSHHEYEGTMILVNVFLPVHMHNVPEECHKNLKCHNLHVAHGWPPRIQHKC